MNQLKLAIAFTLLLSRVPAFGAHLLLKQTPPNVILDEDRFVRLEVTAAADQPTVGPLLVTLAVEGPAQTPPAHVILQFPAPSALVASDFIYIAPSGSTGSIVVSATANGFSRATANIEVSYRDSDADTVPDFKDLCPDTHDPRQFDADGDGQGDACDPDTDVDEDRIQDTRDNCPTLANPDQADSDRDGYGDACDNYPQHPKKD